jgi:hypothetical protein
MKETVIDRYEVTQNQEVIIDVSVGKIEELYEDFDSAATYVKKDLDQDFVDYLIESVREILPSKYIIRINLPARQEDKKKMRVKKSIKNYFLYLEELERRMLKMLFKRSVYYCGLGLLLLFFSLSHQEKETSSLFQQVFFEGLVIAAWVSMWQACANLIIHWGPYYRNIRIFRSIMAQEVVFQDGTAAFD